jgi:hypothetical protein
MTVMGFQYRDSEAAGRKWASVQFTQKSSRQTLAGVGGDGHAILQDDYAQKIVLFYNGLTFYPR